MRRLSFFIRLICFSTLCNILVALPVSAQFAGGTGTKNNPWQISSVSEFNQIRKYLGDEHKDKYFLLVADLDCEDWLLRNSPDRGWNSFGYGEQTTQFFNGHFDGNEKTISNLWIKGDNMGLFCWLGKDGVISNLNVVLHEKGFNGEHSYTGGLVGYNEGTILNCSFSGSVTSNIESFPTGGLVGRNLGTISDSFVTGSITANGKGYYNGGLAGDNYGSISNCYTNVIMTGNGDESYVGGLAGMNKGVISCSYTSGTTISNGSNVPTGGLVGWNFSEISNSYTTGKVIANHETGRAGSLAGWNEGYIFHCYAIGIAKSITTPGGLVGWNINKQDSRIMASYYNEKNAEGVGLPGKKEAEVYGLDLIAFTEKQSFSNWPFAGSASLGSKTTPWLIQEGKTCPYLWWQKDLTTELCVIDMPRLVGASTWPEAGSHPVLYGETFDFRVTLDPDCSESDITVRANGKTLVSIIPDQSDNPTADEIPYSFYYRIAPVNAPVKITVEGIIKNGTVNNISLNDPVIKLYSQNGQLIIETVNAQDIHIYSATGALETTCRVDGVKMIPMQKGIYFVRTSTSGSYKIVVE